MKIRKQRRFSTSAVLYIPVSVLLILFLFISGISVFLKIIEIEVVGASIYTADDICSASGLKLGDNILFMDTQAVARSIRLDKPYIKDVEITRVPPSAVRIKVTESAALAMIITPEHVLIIDSECRVLQISEVAQEGLIEIRGFIPDAPSEGSALKAKPEPGAETQLGHLKNVLDAIESAGIKNDVSYLDVSNISKVNFGYSGRFRVFSGSLINVSRILRQLPEYVTSLEAARSADVKGDIYLSDKIGNWSFRPGF